MVDDGGPVGPAPGVGAGGGAGDAQPLAKSLQRREQRKRQREAGRTGATKRGVAVPADTGGSERGVDIPADAVAALLQRLDDAVREASRARESLGLGILPEGLVGAVLRRELGDGAGGALFGKVVSAAAWERENAGVEGPDVLPVENVDALVRLVDDLVAALTGKVGSGPSSGPSVPWWELR